MTAEDRILREKLGHKRIILNESQKCCLAMAAVKLGKDLLGESSRLGNIVKRRETKSTARLVCPRKAPSL